MLVVGVKKGRKEKAACCAISEAGDAIQRGGTNSLLQVLVKFSHFSVLVSTCRCYEDDRNYESSEFSFSKHPHALLLLFLEFGGNLFNNRKN